MTTLSPELTSHYDPDIKRFRVQTEIGSRNILDTVQLGFEDLKILKPEIVGLTLFGSHTKGTAKGHIFGKPQSDIDCCLFVDHNQLRNANSNFKNHKIHLVPFEEASRLSYAFTFSYQRAHDAYTQTLLSCIRNRFIQKQNLMYENLEIDIFLHPISEEIIDTLVALMLPKRFEHLKPPQFRIKQSLTRISTDLSEMFHMQAGHGLNKYRRYLIDKLLEMGEQGENIWRLVVGETQRIEQFRKRKKCPNYPQSLEHAREIYCR